VIADKPSPFIIQFPVTARSVIIPVYKTDIAVDNLKGGLLRIVKDKQVTNGIIGTLIFQTDFKAVFHFRFTDGNMILPVLLIVLFINAKVNFALKRTNIESISHTFLFIFAYQFTASVAFETAKDGDTFLIPAFFGKHGNIQNAGSVIDG